MQITISATEAQRLIRIWKQRALSQLRCEQETTDETGKRLVSHGAACYANCALELEELLKGNER